MTPFPAGFYCPGAQLDLVNEVGGSRPIILLAGETQSDFGGPVAMEVEEEHFVITKNMTLEADAETFNATSFRLDLAAV